jgi:DNA invertase Pin-like site-specific DNA recombinase
MTSQRPDDPSMPGKLTLASLLRVSTPGQVEEGYGLDEQQRGVQALYARTGHHCFETLVDGGISGTIRDRPAVRRILELLKSGAIQGIVTPAVDRIGRGADVIHSILREIREEGGVVLYANLDLPEGPAGILLENVLIGLAEYDHANIRARTMSGRVSKAYRGKYPARLHLYGYRLVTKAQALAVPEYAGRDGELVIEAAEAAIIRTLYERTAAREPRYRLVKWLTERGVKGARGGAPTELMLRRWLRNPAYRGEAVFGEYEWRPYQPKDAQGKPAEYDGKRHVRRRRRPDGGIMIPCPPIVSSELWHEVQRVLDESQESAALRGPRTTTYLLRGAIFCGACQREDGTGHIAMHGHRRTRNSCRPGYHHLEYVCNRCNRCVLAERAERRARQALERIEVAQVEAQIRQHWRRASAAQEDLVAQIQQQQRLLQECVEAEDRVAVMIAAGLSAEAVARFVKGVHAKRAAARAELARLEREAGDVQGEELAVIQARARVERMQRDLAAAGEDPARVQALFQQYVRVIVNARGQVFARTSFV